jgi:hypothetical protein
MSNYDKLFRVAIYFEIAKNSLVITALLTLFAFLMYLGCER